MAIMSPTLSLKDRISSPLEARHPIADGYKLPHRLTSALEYASKRLARKETSVVTLLAVQREYQLPNSRLSPSAHPSSLASPSWSQLRAEASGNSTPTRHSFASSAFSTLKQLIRASVTTEPPIRERIVHIIDTHHDHSRRDIISPALSDVSASSASTASTTLTSDSLFSQHIRWPMTPAYESEPPTPVTVASSMSATETGSTVSGLGLHPDDFVARFVHLGTLSPRDERVLSMTIEKTARKFSIGFVPPPPAPLSPKLTPAQPLLAPHPPPPFRPQSLPRRNPTLPRPKRSPLRLRQPRRPLARPPVHVPRGAAVVRAHAVGDAARGRGG